MKPVTMKEYYLWGKDIVKIMQDAGIDVPHYANVCHHKGSSGEQGIKVSWRE